MQRPGVEAELEHSKGLVPRSELPILAHSRATTHFNYYYYRVKEENFASKEG